VVVDTYPRDHQVQQAPMVLLEPRAVLVLLVKQVQMEKPETRDLLVVLEAQAKMGELVEQEQRALMVAQETVAIVLQQDWHRDINQAPTQLSATASPTEIMD